MIKKIRIWETEKYKIIVYFISIIGISLFFSCSFAGEGGRKDFDYYYDDTENPVNNTFTGNEIIVKLKTAVPLHEIDTLIPGVRIKTFAYLGSNKYVLYRLDNEYEKENVLISLKVSGKIIAAESNAEYSLCFIPDDEYYMQYQYSPRITQCEGGWDVTTGNSSVNVAVVDSGINGMHEELAGRVLPGINIVTGESIPASENSDDIGHGTHVSGIIAAKGNNGTGIAGVAWNVNLLPVKIFGTDIYTTAAHVAEGLIWSVRNDARVVNMSLAGGLYSIAVHDAVNYALQNNVVLVAAMGNDFKNIIRYPAALPGVIAVASTNGKDEVSFYSSSGNHISVAAPGESIYSLDYSSNSGYMFGSGTSMASPFVAGIAALLLSENPDFSPEVVRSIIEESADKLGEDDFSTEYGYGRVNVARALTWEACNNYGSIRVAVTNNGEPVGGVKVLLEDTDTLTIIQAGLTSYGGSNGVGENGVVVFNHLRLGNYNVRVHIGEAKNHVIVLASPDITENVSFDFQTSLVLVVNGIKENDMTLLTDEYLYMQKLTDLDKYFSIWKVSYSGPPPAELVQAYDMVIWFTGKTMDDPDKNIEVLSDQEITVIKDYLDSGGLLYLCGNNIAEHLFVSDPDFLQNYLHAQYLYSPMSHDELVGKGFLENLYLIINMDDDDQIGLEPGAAGILDSSDDPDENDWAGLIWDQGYRLVFTTIVPNEIFYPAFEDNTFLEDCIKWLESGGEADEK